MSSRELTEWQAYDQVEPIGLARGDFLAGLIAATVANASRDPEKHAPFLPDEFMVDWWGDRSEAAGQEYDVDSQIALVEVLNIAFGGKDLRKDAYTN